ncbi:DUF4277 domain-containing protein [Bacillus sp. FJAT-47783]|uniref:DUF4277 domain-containing protein n=1 Tax=Bacillus sp. FJAT-47783 TaxID=2922712 RepID=UPI001FAD8424|nr:DUF4277 domain-containing protein [Bacillus sp. FJAT-47783]
MNIQIDHIYQQSYLNLLSAIMKQLHIPQTFNEMVEYDSQCLTTPGDIVQLVVLDILSGRQALVHLEPTFGRCQIKKFCFFKGKCSLPLEKYH